MVRHGADRLEIYLTLNPKKQGGIDAALIEFPKSPSKWKARRMMLPLGASWNG